MPESPREKYYKKMYVLLGADTSRALSLLEKLDCCCPQVRQAQELLRRGLKRVEQVDYDSGGAPEAFPVDKMGEIR